MENGGISKYTTPFRHIKNPKLLKYYLNEHLKYFYTIETQNILTEYKQNHLSSSYEKYGIYECKTKNNSI